MNRIAEFKKVSNTQFISDIIRIFPDITEQKASELYDEIILPKRATSGSAGYDFYLPLEEITLEPMQTIIIPTGIRAKIDDGWMLMCCPRSGLGFKFRLRLDNTVGIIDSDYYNADNEGHIQIKLTNEAILPKTLSLKKGAAFAQGIFLPYGITINDSVDQNRIGGFGSTD